MTSVANLTEELKEVAGFISFSSVEWLDRRSGSQTLCALESLRVCWHPTAGPHPRVSGSEGVGVGRANNLHLSQVSR